MDYQALGVDYNSVSAAVALATNDGDRVFIPAGAATWLPSQFISYTAGIQIIGAGMDQANATPNPANATIITCGLKAFAPTFNNPITNPGARISGMVLEMSTVSDAKTFLLTLNGLCYRQRVSGNIVGGLRVDHIRIRNSSDCNISEIGYNQASTTSVGSQTLPGGTNTFTFNVASNFGFKDSGDLSVGSAIISYTGRTGGNAFTGCTSSSTATIANNTAVKQRMTIGLGNLIVNWAVGGAGQNSYITGSWDHNFLDYVLGTTGGSEVFNFANVGVPDGSLPSSGGFYQGQYGWEINYTYGGGDDTELNVIYQEDNIYHRNGFVGGTDNGGPRIVQRHNTTWGPLTNHGIDTGGDNGSVSFERYNNLIDNLVAGSFSQGSGTAGAFGIRGGSNVIFNNVCSIVNGAPFIASGLYRPAATTNSMVGPATGRNYMDQNETGTISYNGFTFAPDVTATQPTDPRVGSIYSWSGTTGGGTMSNFNSATRTVTLPGLDGTKNWSGFVVVDTVLNALDQNLGDQGSSLTVSQVTCYWLIQSNSGNVVTFSLPGSTAGGPKFVNGHTWEVRRVKQYFCQPGSGKVQFLSNNGNNGNAKPNTGNADTTGYAFQTADVNGKHKYWGNIVPYGNYQFNNLVRTSLSTPWSSALLYSFSSFAPAVLNWTYPGGVNDGLPTYNKNDKNGLFGGSAYPTAPAQTIAYRRVGADWNAPGYTETITDGTDGLPSNHPEALPATAYGSTYPNLMVQASITVSPLWGSTTGTGSTVTSADGTLTVPASSTGGVQLNISSGTNTCQYSKNDNVTFTTFTSGTVVSAANGDKFKFQITGAALNDSDTISVLDVTTGASVGTATLTRQVPQTSVISISGSLAFGGVRVGTSTALQVQVSGDSGNTPFTVNSISDGVGDGVFTFGITTPFTVTPGSPMGINVTFKPTSATSYNRTITFDVSGNSPAVTGTNTIAATGTGTTVRLINFPGRKGH